MKNRLPAVAAAASLALLGGAHADTIHASWAAPSLDRWMYPFNSTPGTRPVISTFGSTPGGTDFDSRDGQMLVGFATGTQVPTGQGSNLTVTRARLWLEVANDRNFAYDPTPDAWQCFIDPADPSWQADTDPGQAVECFGVGYRNGWTLQTFQENTAYAPSGTNVMLPGVRNAYAAGFDGSGALVDVSQSPRQRWQPKAWAAGTIDGLAPGTMVPIGSQMHFDLDVSDPNIQAYLRSGLNTGKVMLALTSLTFVQQGGGAYPAFIAKENNYVALGISQAARLELDVQNGPSCRLADLNCDNKVDGADLGILLGDWGPSSGGSDLNHDGKVDGADLGILLGEWR
jgi:hypothetical protein